MMMDFISKLYNNDNFVLYLTIILVVLVILFVIVLIFGKKDQKLEETKKLQKIEIEHAFKEENDEPIKLEANNNLKEEPKEEIPPLENEADDLKLEPKQDVKEKEEEPEEVKVMVFNPPLKEETDSLVINDVPKEEPLKIAKSDLEELDEINNSIAEGINNLENIKKEFNDIEIPRVEIEENTEKDKEFEKYKDKVKQENDSKPTEVFSSVYVPLEKEKPKIIVEKETKVEKPTLIAQKDEEDEEFVLPTLASENENKPSAAETKKEDNVADLTTCNFDDLPNETYKLK